MSPIGRRDLLERHTRDRLVRGEITWRPRPLQERLCDRRVQSPARTVGADVMVRNPGGRAGKPVEEFAWMKLRELKGLVHGPMLVGAIVLMSLPAVICGAIAWLIADAQKGWAIDAKLAGVGIGVAIGAVISAVIVGVFGSSLGQWWANRKQAKAAPEPGAIEKARKKGLFGRSRYP